MTCACRCNAVKPDIAVEWRSPLRFIFSDRRTSPHYATRTHSGRCARCFQECARSRCAAACGWLAGTPRRPPSCCCLSRGTPKRGKGSPRRSPGVPRTTPPRVKGWPHSRWATRSSGSRFSPGGKARRPGVQKTRPAFLVLSATIVAEPGMRPRTSLDGNELSNGQRPSLG